MQESDLKPASELRTRLRFQPDSGQIWLDQQRMIMIHTEAMGELRRELIDTLGRDRARGVLTRMGYASGIRDARFARRLFPTASDSEVFVVGPQLHNLEGIVNVRPVRFEMDVARGICDGEFIWENSFEADVHRSLYGIDTEPACWMQIGYASGYTSNPFGQQVLYREVECSAQGRSRLSDHRQAGCRVGRCRHRPQIFPARKPRRSSARAADPG